MSTLGDMLKYLPPRLAEAIAEECGRLGADDGAGAEQRYFVTELRLRRELPCSLTLSDGRNIPLPISARRSELSAVLARMTENSLHTHAAALRQGYIRLPDGSRVGVCGRAAERSQSGSAVGIGEINSKKSFNTEILSPQESCARHAVRLCRRERRRGRAKALFYFVTVRSPEYLNTYLIYSEELFHD